jgi:hypothetical protein
LLALGGCGSDSESTTAPQSTAITRETSPQSTAESTTTESTTTTEDNGGTPASGGGDNTSSDGGSGGSSVPDTPSNDVTPPANTPQGKFEQYCNQNPGACG